MLLVVEGRPKPRKTGKRRYWKWSVTSPFLSWKTSLNKLDKIGMVGGKGGRDKANPRCQEEVLWYRYVIGNLFFLRTMFL